MAQASLDSTKPLESPTKDHLPKDRIYALKQAQLAAPLFLLDSGSKAALSSSSLPCLCPANTKGSSNLLPILDKPLPAGAKKTN